MSFSVLTRDEAAKLARISSRQLDRLIATAAGQSVSRCGDETVTMRAGEVWTFDNLIEHDVRNPGNEDRIVCIVSMRVEK